MRRQVKHYRLVHYYVETPNPLDPSAPSLLTERTARNGAWLNSGPGTDTEFEKYNVREVDFARGENDGWFAGEGEDPISPANVPGMDYDPVMTVGGFDIKEGQVEPYQGDDLTPVPVPDVVVEVPEDTILTEGIPSMPLSDLAQWQLGEVIQAGTPVQTLLSAIKTSSDPEGYVNRLLAAENEVTGGEPRDELVYGVAAVLGDAPDPEAVRQGIEPAPWAEGGMVQPDVPEGNAFDPNLEHVDGQPVRMDAVNEGSPESTPDAEAVLTGVEPPPDAQVEGEPPTEAAVRYAEEAGIDLGAVQGTGKGGRITEHDVKAFEKSLSE